MTDESKPNNPHKTHEKLVSMANEIFAQLKRWQELAEMDEATREAQPYPLSDEAEMEDFWKGRQSVIYMGNTGDRQPGCLRDSRGLAAGN